jgi:hypothetical protein
MDTIDLTEDRDQWRALVNTVMNLQFPWTGSSWVAAQLAASQEGLSSMMLVSSAVNEPALRGWILESVDVPNYFWERQ